MGRNNRQRRAAKQRKRAGGHESTRRPTTHESGRGYNDHDGWGSPLDGARLLVDSLVVLPHVTADDLRQGVDRLDVLPSPGGRHSGSLIVENVLRQLLEHLWRFGWQPADVARVTRELGLLHRALVVDAIAAQHLAYDGVELHPVWAGQLADLGVERWWAPTPTWLEQRAERAGVSRPATLLAAVELARRLARLGSLPLLLPPPGAPPTWNADTGVDQRVLAKIRALLAKAESTTFPDEAEALTSKAQELMSRHAVDAALLHGNRARPIGRRVGIDDPYAEAKALLLQVVAGANGCRAVWSKDISASTVVGYSDQLALVELLYTSLLTQGTTSLVAAGRSDRSRRQPGFRRAFLHAYAIRLGERLDETERRVEAEAVDEHGSGLVPVLAARRSAVDEAVDELFPRVEKGRGARFDVRGWVAGQKAADQADLGHRGRVAEAPDGQLLLPGNEDALAS
jgi:hypothetical protein